MNYNSSISSSPSSLANYSTEIVQVKKDHKKIQRPEQTSPLFTCLPWEILTKVLNEIESEKELLEIRSTCRGFNKLIREILFRDLNNNEDSCDIEDFFMKVSEVKTNPKLHFLVSDVLDKFNVISFQKYMVYLANPKKKEGLKERQIITSTALSSLIAMTIIEIYHQHIMQEIEKKRRKALQEMQNIFRTVFQDLRNQFPRSFSRSI